MVKVLNLAIILFCQLNILYSQNISFVETEKGIEVSENGKKVLFFQADFNEVDGKYPRTFYIHPLYDMDGNIMTEDKPEDHPHHHGIFWAWHQHIINGEEKGDSWLEKNVEWRAYDVHAEEYEGEHYISTSIMWSSALDDSVLLMEKSKIIIHPAKKNHRCIDFEIELNAVNENTYIGGDKGEKGYGGFSIRMVLPDDVKFTSSKGEVVPQNLQINADYWMDISGTFFDNKKSGLTIICHQDNPGYPQPWILRKKGSMQNVVWPGKEPVLLPVEESILLKYRIIIYRENLKTGLISAKF